MRRMAFQRHDYVKVSVDGVPPDQKKQDSGQTLISEDMGHVPNFFYD